MPYRTIEDTTRLIAADEGTTKMTFAQTGLANVMSSYDAVRQTRPSLFAWGNSSLLSR
jgi:hypothetical protein